MFFDPTDYLRADPGAAPPREADQLRREAAQRARLCEATTRLAAKGGLEAAAIHHAARAAGVGQGTYYRLYESREACLREAFERCADTVLGRVMDAAAAAGEEASERLEAGLAELLALLDAHPEVARLLLVGILAGDELCREARERWVGRLAGLLANGGAGGGAPRRGSLAWLAAGAMVSVLALRWQEGGAPSASGMFEELLSVGAWPRRGADFEAAPSAESTLEEERKWVEAAQERHKSTQLARGRRAQRERIVEAMTEVVGAKGYRGARVGDVARAAGVSAPLFYTHFSSKEQCLLEVFDAELARLVERVEAAVRSAGSCAERVLGGLQALLRELSRHTAAARVLALEVKACGARGQERYASGLREIARAIGEGGDRSWDEGEREVAAVVAEALGATIEREMQAGRGAEMQGLLSEFAFAALAPYVGGEEAARVAGRRRVA